MKLLLTAINAKYIHSNLAIYSLRAYAGALSSHIELAEFTINHRTEDILREIYLRKPDVLLFSCYIWNIVYVRELAENLKKLMPEVPVWLGGPEVSYDAEAFLRGNPAVDGILCGEGEEVFRRLAECYVKGQADMGSLSRIPGLAFRDEEGVVHTNPPAPLMNLDSLPFPYADLTDFAHRIIYYESSRGCPFSCSYCLSSVEKRVRFRNTETVCRELQFFLDRNVPQVKFVDRTFNSRKDHAMTIWRYLLDHDNGLTNFHFEIEAELLDEEELELLGKLRPGLVQLEIGVQSANQKTLQAVRRRTDLEKLRGITERIWKGRNIHQHLDLIAGLPFEDYESFGRSFNVVFSMKPEQLQLGFLKVLKGSPMHRDARGYGIVWNSRPPYEVLFTPWLSFGDILRLKMIEEMVEIYYNSHQFGRTMERLIPCFSSPFEFFEELADDYQARQGDRKASRQQRFELLLDFIRKKLPKEENRYRELLTVDYYLRERAKARPAFAPDQKPYQEKLGRIRRSVPKQAHVEALITAEGASDGNPAYLVFDYETRDPLTGDAYLWRWTEEEQR